PVCATPDKTRPAASATCTVWPSPATLKALPSVETAKLPPSNTIFTGSPGWITGGLRSASRRSGSPAAIARVAIFPSTCSTLAGRDIQSRLGLGQGDFDIARERQGLRIEEQARAIGELRADCAWYRHQERHDQRDGQGQRR